MAVPTNTYEQYATLDSLKEDISELIFNISPVETPGLSMCGVSTASQRLHQWQIDSLEDEATGALNPVDTSNGTVAAEGDDASVQAATPTTLLGNYSQINTRSYAVSGSLESADKYGRDSQLAYEAAKTARFLKNVVDTSITGLNQPAVAGSSGVVRRTASLEAWLTSNVSHVGTNPTLSGGIPNAGRVDGTTRTLTAGFLDTVIQSAWENGGKPTTILAGGTQKTAISAFDGLGNVATASTARTDRASRTIYATADTYYSNFGVLNVVPSRHIRKTATFDRNVFLLDPEYIKVAYNRTWQQWDLAKTGDSIQRQMLVEWSLEVCNEAAHGLIADLKD